MGEVVEEIVTKFNELSRLLDMAKSTVTLAVEEQKARLEPAIGKREAAKILGRSVSWLERRMKEPNPPPHYKDGSGRVDFYASELRAWKSAYRVGTI